MRLSRGPVTATVPLITVMSNPRENIYLRTNDVLTLVRDPQTFVAVGALGNSTELPFQADGITLAQAGRGARPVGLRRRLGWHVHLPVRASQRRAPAQSRLKAARHAAGAGGIPD